MRRLARASLLPVAGIVVGVVAAVGWLGWGGRPGLAEADRQGLSTPAGLRSRQAEDVAAMAARLAAVERAVSQIEAGTGRAAAVTPLAPGQQAGPSPHADRFVLAMLHLQAAVATARPWLREYELATSLAPPPGLPPALAEVLASNAARGLATEAALLERFVMLTPTIVARAPRTAGVLEQTESVFRSIFSGIGLAAPPAASDMDAAVQRIQEQLRRGNLAAAVSDATMLDAGVQPLLSGWLAQARARLAVEQAIQETLLRAIGARNMRPG